METIYELVRRIMTATNRIDGVYYLLGKKNGINENTLAFLYALSDGKSHSQKEISDEWIIPRTTINSIVKSLLADGFIQFSGEAHGKEKAIILTKRGQQYADELFTKIYAAEEYAIRKTLEKYPSAFILALEDFSENLHQAFTKE